jgi:hypothetical protein
VEFVNHPALVGGQWERSLSGGQEPGAARFEALQADARMVAPVVLRTYRVYLALANDGVAVILPVRVKGCKR